MRGLLIGLLVTSAVALALAPTTGALPGTCNINNTVCVDLSQRGCDSPCSYATCATFENHLPPEDTWGKNTMCLQWT